MFAQPWSPKLNFPYIFNMCKCRKMLSQLWQPAANFSGFFSKMSTGPQISSKFTFSILTVGKNILYQSEYHWREPTKTFWLIPILYSASSMTPDIPITTRKIRKLDDILEVGSRRTESWWRIFFSRPMYPTFLESLGLKEVTYIDFRYPDHHQEDQEAQWHPPSKIKVTWILMMKILFQTHIYCLFGILRTWGSQKW